MRRLQHHVCADCGAPTDKFLCERCAEICEALTAEGKYYAYRKDHLDRNDMPQALDPPKTKRQMTRSRPTRRHYLAV